MKNKFGLLKRVFCFIIGAVLFFGLTYAESIGLGNAVLYSGKVKKFVACLEKEDYSGASQYLSFYGSDNVKEARSRWAEKMEAADMVFEKIDCGKMYPDDGISKCYVTAALDNGKTIFFHIVVQGRGLAIVATSECSMMTTYNPG